MTPLEPMRGPGQPLRLNARPSAARDRLLAVIAAHPGVSLNRAACAAGISTGNAGFHLSRLRGAGLVVAYVRGMRHHYFPAGWTGQQAATAVLESDERLAALLRVAAGGRLRQLDFHEALGWPRSTVQHGLERLVARGALRVHRQGRRIYYEVATPRPFAGDLHDAAADFQRIEAAYHRAEEAGHAAAFYAAVREVAA